MFAEQRATRDCPAVETRIAVRERDLGQLARAAYQTNGAMGDWAIVLASTTPNQLADRIAFLQSVGNCVGVEEIATYPEVISADTP